MQRLSLCLIFSLTLFNTSCGKPDSAPTYKTIVRPPLPCAAEARPVDSSGLGIPFRIDPQLVAAGYGLNTNNDQTLNFGEFSEDCGGAGNRICAFTPALLSVQIDGSSKQTVTTVIGDVEFTLEWGTVNSTIPFTVLYPTGPETSQLPRRDVGMIVEGPTRAGSNFAPSQETPPLSLTSTAISYYGGASIRSNGVTGNQPFVFSAQQALVLSALLRRDYGANKVVIGGGSYGAGVAYFAGQSYPQSFDGIVAAGATVAYEPFEAWHELLRLRMLGTSVGAFGNGYEETGIRDNLGMSLYQAGLRIGTLNAVDYPQHVRVPTVVVMGGADWVFRPGDLPARLARQIGSSVPLQFFVYPEASHGESSTVSAQATTQQYTALFQMMDQHVPSTVIPCNRPRKDFSEYDDMLRDVPTPTLATGVQELWSTAEPTRVNANVGGAAFYPNDAGAEDLYIGSLQGWVERWTWDGSAPKRLWRAQAGRDVQSVVVYDTHADGRPEVYVGSLTGLQVFDSVTGAVVPRAPSPHRRAAQILFADVIPGNSGDELIYRVSRDILRIEDPRSGRVLVESLIGIASQFVVKDWAGATSPSGKPPGRLYAALGRGHVVRFRFEARDGQSPYVPVADWISAFLGKHLRSIAWVSSNGGERLAAVGMAGGPGSKTIDLINPDGSIFAQAPARTTKTRDGGDHLVAWGPNQVLVGGRDVFELVDFQTPSASRRISNEVGNIAAGNFRGQGREVVAFAGHEGAGPQVDIYDAQLTLQYSQRGMETPTAVSLNYSNARGRWELSMLDEDWVIHVLDPRTGNELTQFQYPKPVFASLKPMRLVRKVDTLSAAAYEIFFHDGDVHLATGARVAEKCGLWWVTASIYDEHFALATYPFPSVPCCEAAESNDPTTVQVAGKTVPWKTACTKAPYPLPTPPPFILSNWFEYRGSVLGNPASTPTNALRLASFDGPQSHIVMTTTNGQILTYAIDDAVAALATGLPVSSTHKAKDVLGDANTALASGDLDGDGRDEIVVGTWLAHERNGSNTVSVFDEDLTVLAAAQIPYVTGVLVADYDSDGVNDVIVGTQTGAIVFLDNQLKEHFRIHAGDMAAGEANVLHFVPGSAGAPGVLIAGVTAGMRAFEVDPSQLPSR